MSLKYIIDGVCSKLGMDPVEDRDALLVRVNEAAREVYESTDLPGSLREMTLLIPSNLVIALPYYVGELRAMRGYYDYQKINLVDLAVPKYSFNGWETIWNNWRLIKKSPICKTITNAAVPIELSIANNEEDDLEITVTGSTTESNRVSETVYIQAGERSVSLTRLFTDIQGITKSAPCQQNITVTGKDSLGTVFTLAVIPNDKLQAIYTLVDVSQLPYCGDVSSSIRYVEILYKEPLPEFQNDGDEFILGGYDSVIVCKVCEVWYSEQSGPEGTAKALDWYAKGEDLKSKKIENTNGATEKGMIFAPNPLLGLFSRCY